METPWQKQMKPRHQRQEERLGRLPGGSQGLGSGRIWRFKRDGRLFGFLIEARTTEKGSYSINRAEFEKVRQDAHLTPPGCLPAMQIEIQSLNLIAIDLDVFIEMQNELISLRESRGQPN